MAEMLNRQETLELYHQLLNSRKINLLTSKAEAAQENKEHWIFLREFSK